MVVFILWLVLAAVVAWIAGERGRKGGRWFLLSLLLSPIVGAIALALSPKLTPNDKKQGGQGTSHKGGMAI